MMSSVLSKIESKAYTYAQSGLECPNFVHVSPDVYTDMVKESQNHGISPSYGPNYGVFTISVLTNFGQLYVKVCNTWPPNSIVVGNHPLITILNKLGFTI